MRDPGHHRGHLRRLQPAQAHPQHPRDIQPRPDHTLQVHRPRYCCKKIYAAANKNICMTRWYPGVGHPAGLRVPRAARDQQLGQLLHLLHHRCQPPHPAGHQHSRHIRPLLQLLRVTPSTFVSSSSLLLSILIHSPLVFTSIYISE